MHTVNKNDTLLLEQGRNKVLFLPSHSARVFLPPIQSSAELIGNNVLCQPTELVKGLLHRGTKAILGGSSKAGKTWVLLDLAVAVANGSDFLQHQTNRGKVLFINLEIQPAFIKERLLTLAKSREIDNLDNLDVWNLRGQEVSSGKILPAMAERLRDVDYSLIVIDPIYKLMRDRSENSSLGVGSHCHDIDRLAEKSGAAIVYAHHFTKGNQAGKNAMDRLAGSGVFARDADTIITLTEHQSESCFSVEVTQRNIASPKPFVVQWNWPVMSVRPDLDPCDLNDGKGRGGPGTSALLLSLLEDHPLTTTEWQTEAESGGVSRATFFRRKTQLEANGDVKQDPATKLWSLVSQEVSRETCET